MGQKTHPLGFRIAANLKSLLAIARGLKLCLYLPSHCSFKFWAMVQTIKKYQLSHAPKIPE